MQNKLKDEILGKIKEYYRLYHKPIHLSFLPGEDIISYGARVYDEEEIVNLVDASLEFWLTSGRYADKFETDFANFMGQQYCLLTASGSSANLLALSALTSDTLGDTRLKAGDEIITVAAGFPTTVNPIVQNGLVPVFVDIDIQTYNILPNEVEKALSKKTKAIMIAHTLGNPFDLDVITKLTKENGLYLIEDCCDAVGSTYDGKMVGTFGDLATVSFYPAHHMTMGEGGAVLTKNSEYECIVRSLRDWGRDCFCKPGVSNTCENRFNNQYGTLPAGYDHKYVYSHIGYNMKITEMQAAIGVAQLAKLPNFIEARKENFNKILSALSRYQDYFYLPQKNKKAAPSWFGFPLTVKENKYFSKNDIVNYLENNKIMTRQLFAGNLIRQPAYKNVNYKVIGDLSNTDYAMNNTFFIGVYPGINEIKINYIIDVFQSFFKKLKLN